LLGMPKENVKRFENMISKKTAWCSLETYLKICVDLPLIKRIRKLEGQAYHDRTNQRKTFAARADHFNTVIIAVMIS